jgi:hypothetical protein
MWVLSCTDSFSIQWIFSEHFLCARPCRRHWWPQQWRLQWASVCPQGDTEVGCCQKVEPTCQRFYPPPNVKAEGINHLVVAMTRVWWKPLPGDAPVPMTGQGLDRSPCSVGSGKSWLLTCEAIIISLLLPWLVYNIGINRKYAVS